MEEMEMRKEKKREGRMQRKEGKGGEEGKGKGKEKGRGGITTVNMRERPERRTEREKDKANEMKYSLAQQGLRVRSRERRSYPTGLNVLRKSALTGWQTLIGSGHELILTLYCYHCLQPHSSLTQLYHHQ